MAYHEPLAERMRPRTIDEIIGQDKAIGPKSTLYKMIQNGHTPSMILYGPPGTGKTSIAFAIANSSKLEFHPVHAATTGKKDLEDVIQNARLTRNVLLFVDEIHLLNKTQQDALLKALEDGTIILIGATTENPYHSVRGAILSRVGQIVQLNNLQPQAIKQLLKRAITDESRGLGKYEMQLTEEQLDLISRTTGDARSALTLLESIMWGSDRDETGRFVVETETVKEIIESRGFIHDKKGDVYYDLLSAFQKSIRGSDVDAALYYLARLLEGGDLVAISRRLLVIGYEDIGLANPELAARVLPAIQTVERLGLPEGRIPLATITVELCLSAKSNTAYKALDSAIHYVQHERAHEIPAHLKDSHYDGAKKLGHGVTYQYPHDAASGWVAQQYLPDDMEKQGTVFYKGKQAGEEKRLVMTYEKLRQLKQK